MALFFDPLNTDRIGPGLQAGCFIKAPTSDASLRYKNGLLVTRRFSRRTVDLVQAMTRLDRSFALFIAALLLWLCAPLAHAAFPATQTNTSACTVAPCYSYYVNNYQAQTTASSAAAACALLIPHLNTTAGSQHFWVLNYTTETSCATYLQRYADGSTFNNTNYGITKPSVAPAAPVYSCPTNSTLAGNQCTCNAPAWVQDGNACTSLQGSMNKSCNALASGLNLVGAPMVHFGTAGLTACFGGYVMSGTGAASGGGQTELYGPFKCSGADASACSVVPKPSDITATCAQGSYPGTVNGVQVCVPPTTSVEAPKTTTTAPPAGGGPAPELPGAPPGSTTEEKQTECQGPSCSTTTTYKDGAGTSTGTKTETVSKASYCAENPKAPGCGSAEASTFSGSCGSFTFKGDAIQGAIAREIHTQNCLMNATTPESAKYDAAKVKTGDQTTTLPGNSTISFGPASFDTSDSIGGKQCIGNITGTIYGVTITLPVGTYICPHAQNLRLVLLALSFLAGFYIIARRS